MAKLKESDYIMIQIQKLSQNLMLKKTSLWINLNKNVIDYFCYYCDYWWLLVIIDDYYWLCVIVIKQVLVVVYTRLLG